MKNNIRFDLSDYYAVIKFSRPGHTEMGNEPYMVTPRWYALQICRLQLI